MSTTPISANSTQSDYQSYFSARNSDLKQLGQALRSGDLAAAQQEFQAIQDLSQSGPFANGVAFQNSGREQAFEGIGKALQSGDLQSAQEAFAHLMHSHRAHPPVLGGPETPVVSSSGQPVAGSGGVNVIA